MIINLTFFEFDKITKDDIKAKINDAKIDEGAKEAIAQEAFKNLKELIITSKDDDIDFEDEDNDTLGKIKNISSCMWLSSKNGKEAIALRNYVGVIALKNDVIIEVLPKISKSKNEDDNEDDKVFARKIVVEMLRTCGYIKPKSFQNANLAIDRLPLFDAYIRLFLDEALALYKRGLKAGYVSYEDNENFLKGKLKFNEHIKHNFAHKEKFYVKYDLYSFDRAENRLIKSTLLYLKNKSNDEGIKKDLRKLIMIFDDIAPSENIEGDFAKCAKGRDAKEYESVMSFCCVFLRKKSYTMYAGDNNATALLFPMEKLYEKYIAHEIRKAIKEGCVLTEQSKKHYLFDNNKFNLEPDIMLDFSDKQTIKRTIVDTKWKCLTQVEKYNYSISQADMYQMYAYHTKCYDKDNNIERVILLYPYYSDLNNTSMDKQPVQYTTTIDNKQLRIYIAFIDLKQYINGDKSKNLNPKNFKGCLYPLNYSNISINWGDLLYLR